MLAKQPNEEFITQAQLAADLGISRTSILKLAKAHGWPRHEMKNEDGMNSYSLPHRVFTREEVGILRREIAEAKLRKTAKTRAVSAATIMPKRSHHKKVESAAPTFWHDPFVEVRKLAKELEARGWIITLTPTK